MRVTALFAPIFAPLGSGTKDFHFHPARGIRVQLKSLLLLIPGWRSLSRFAGGAGGGSTSLRYSVFAEEAICVLVFIIVISYSLFGIVSRLCYSVNKSLIYIYRIEKKLRPSSILNG